ncbi:22507518-6eea-42ef-86ce-b6e344c48e92 [Sclerotinia trifoliorum]|uniref:22507518-6eea-42ef-86ce-b6e344c48e92 n=1 Tax=Sclerotinia trifoliorum TaxID=28548 RepID=A0A8H2VT80_9HELO|nr:22507518-6eea-42ef-86ce-b6e344c48e92 [Sclerotinia trifoliorum]
MDSMDIDLPMEIPQVDDKVELMNAELPSEIPNDVPLTEPTEAPIEAPIEFLSDAPESQKSKPTASKSKISNNAPGYRYKYPEAKPTPPGVDDDRWNKIYVAADSRFYNRAKKNASESRKIRLTGETYQLALRILKERDEKEAEAAADLAAGIVPTPKRIPKPKPPPRPKAPSTSSRDGTPSFNDRVPLSISEQIKSEGRARKTLPPSSQGSPGPPGPKHSSPVPSQMKSEKAEKSLPKKKSTVTSTKKARPKGAKPEGPTEARSQRNSATPGLRNPSDDDDSNDGGEYCICRGPDDHRMMIFCEGGCQDWYHCSCIDVDVEDAKELLDRFICPNCSSETEFTTWKRICRYHNVDGCRKAARVMDDPPSKYCSDEHATAFWEFVAEKLRANKKRTIGGALSGEEFGALLSSCKTATDFHALGSRPKLPIPEGHDLGQPLGLNYLLPEEESAISKIKARRTIIEQRIESFKTAQKLLIMMNRRAKIAQEHPDVDVKEICGYDNRLALNEYEFGAWCASEEGKGYLATGVLGPRTEETKHIGETTPYPGQVIPDTGDLPDELKNLCIKPLKKCKHNGWRGNHAEQYAYATKTLTEELAKLSKQEASIIEDAETREATKDYNAENTVEQLF